MYRSLHRYLLLQGFETLYKRRKTYTYLRELEKSQWESRPKLEAFQFEALRSLLRHAYESCGYYRDRWNALGLRPDGLAGVEDFRQWPVLDRQDIHQNRLGMRTQINGEQSVQKSTGGSTGEPLQFELNLDSNDRRTAAAYRGYGWAGVSPGTKQLHLWGVPLTAGSRRKQWKDAIYHGLHRRQFLSTFGLSDQSFDEYFRTFNACRPDAVVAYTGALYEFARMIVDRGVTPFAPKSILVGAEKLHPFQRELIEKTFRAPLFETYGSREFMLIGAECDRHQGLHLTHENLLVEILDPDGSPTAAGDEGDIVVTDLYNYGMPFIRYRTGDRGVSGWEMCPCGRGLPLLRGVAGRSMDTLTTPDGRRISGALFPHLLKDYPAVRRFQVIQDALDHVELKVIVDANWNETQKASIAQIVSRHLGPRMRFELSRVESIALTAAGKSRVVVNKCAARGETAAEVSETPVSDRRESVVTAGGA